MKTKFGWEIFVLTTFLAIHLHTLLLDQTVEPPPSAVFGNLSGGETRLLDQNPRPEGHFRYYTADPIGTAALYPIDHFILESWSRGEIPLWNPFVLTGIPLVADGYWQIFYPPNALRLLIGAGWWFVYSYIHLVLIAFFLALLYYNIRPRTAEAVLAGIGSFGLGWLLFYLPTLNFISVIPWGILLLACNEILYKNPKSFVGIGLVGVGCFGLGVAGHPTISILCAVAAALYAVAIVASRAGGYRILPSLLAGAALGALVAAPSWINFADAIMRDEVGSISPFGRPNFFTLGQLISFA